ncbi:MAG: glutamate synthase central domain-containing protein [Acidimicrobiales bacterium]
MPYPVLTRSELTDIIHANRDGDHPHLQSAVITALYPIAEGGAGLRRVVEEIKVQVSEAIASGATVIVLTNRGATADLRRYRRCWSRRPFTSTWSTKPGPRPAWSSKPPMPVRCTISPC